MMYAAPNRRTTHRLAALDVPIRYADEHAAYAFGAQCAVRVHADTGEIRVPRLLSVFAAGRIVNPRTARSQFTGGMIMGLSMALHVGTAAAVANAAWHATGVRVRDLPIIPDMLLPGA